MAYMCLFYFFLQNTDPCVFSVLQNTDLFQEIGSSATVGVEGIKTFCNIPTMIDVL
jgi:hypothetical protein